MKLFEPYTFIKSGLTSVNRIVLAPMTNLQSNDDGTLGDDEYIWLTRRAKEGFGIIITCAAHVSKDGQGWRGELGIFDDVHLEGLAKLAKGIREQQSLAIVQLFHGGARSPEDVTGLQPWSASAHEMKVGSKMIDVRKGTKDDIHHIIQAFVDATDRAYRTGFNGVELHGAHGYLLHQFMSTVTNTRSDEWGGNFENRTRLVRTILKSIKEKIPTGFIVGVRLSPEDKYTFQGIDFDESLELARILSEEGADYIHISPWDALKRPDKYANVDKALITYFRESVGNHTPIFVAGEIWTGQDANKALDLGADMVALGRAAIGIPNWPSLVKSADRPIPKPPFTTEKLRNADLGEKFIEYMKKWKGFVDV